MVRVVVLLGDIRVKGIYRTLLLTVSENSSVDG